jgi:hypothetical protein
MTEVCIPDLHAVSSKKARVLTRGTFETSATTGVGWITVNPWRADTTVRLGSKTSSTYAGNASTPLSTVDIGVVSYIGTKFPYPASSWGVDGISHRIVGVGLRVRYTGIELYRGGRAVMLRSPDNKPLIGNDSVASVFGYSQAKTFPVTEQWVMVAYKPVRPGEFEYSANAGTAGASSDDSLFFGVTGTAGPSNASAIFEFEVITHVEYIGEIDNITKSHSDIVGMSEIRNATMQDRPTRKEGKTLWERVVDIGSNVLHSASPMVHDAISQGVTQSFMTGLLQSGKNALGYLQRIPARIEAGAMGALRNTFKGGFLETLGTLAEDGALMLL